MRRLLLAPLILALSSSALAENSISKKAHQACKDVKDYKGCIELRIGKTNKSSEGTRGLAGFFHPDVLVHPDAVVAKEVRGEYGRYLNYRIYNVVEKIEWSVDADCEDYTVNWKGDRKGWIDVKVHKKEYSRVAKKVLDEFCPKMDGIVKKTKLGTITYFQYPLSNTGRSGGGSRTVINQYSMPSLPTFNNSSSSRPQSTYKLPTSNIQGIAGSASTSYPSSGAYGGYLGGN